MRAAALSSLLPVESCAMQTCRARVRPALGMGRDSSALPREPRGSQTVKAQTFACWEHGKAWQADAGHTQQCQEQLAGRARHEAVGVRLACLGARSLLATRSRLRRDTTSSSALSPLPHEAGAAGVRPFPLDEHWAEAMAHR